MGDIVMADRKLRVTVKNPNWMKGFSLRKARTDLPHRNDGDHVHAAHTQNIELRGLKE